ncbi:MAG: hypothetical protein WDZ83_12785 [Rhizobiaceae bacterium]
MRTLATGLLSSSAILLLAGCTTSETLHHEGVTSYAGDAIAANTVLQMVDPWQYGVQDTDLETPAERPWRRDPGASAPGASASQAKP